MSEPEARRRAALALCAPAAVVALACGGDPGEPVPPEDGYQLYGVPAVLRLVPGETRRLVVRARNGLPVERQEFWFGDRIGSLGVVARVDGNGDVTGREPGEDVILVHALVGGRGENGRVPVLVRGVRVAPASARLAVGERLQATWKVVAGFGTSSQAVTWRSSDTALVGVTAGGEFVGRRPGVATITATSVADPALRGVAAVVVCCRP